MNKQKILQAIELLKEAIREDTRLPDLMKNKKEYKITEEQGERWKKMKPTNKTKDLLKKKGISGEEIPYIKTQWDAHIILNNLKSENI